MFFVPVSVGGWRVEWPAIHHFAGSSSRWAPGRAARAGSRAGRPTQPGPASQLQHNNSRLHNKSQSTRHVSPPRHLHLHLPSPAQTLDDKQSYEQMTELV